MKRKKRLLIMAGVILILCCVIGIEQAVTQHIDSINTTDEIILSIEQDTLTSVSWTYEDTTLSFTCTDNVWYDSDDTDFPVNQDTLTDFLSWFEEVHACFIIDDVNDYSQYGLEDPQCTITLQTEDEEIVVSVGDYSTMDEQRYIEIGDGKVYLIEDDILTSVVTDRDEFMQHDDSLSLDTLTELTVSGNVEMDAVYDPDGSYTYTDSYDYYYVTEDDTYLILDNSLVESYLSTLSSLSLTDYVTYTASDADLSEYGLDDPAYTITVTGTTEAYDSSDDSNSDDSSDDTANDSTESTSDNSSEDSSGNSSSNASSEDTGTGEIKFVLYIGTVSEVTTDDDGEDAVTVTAYARVGDSEIIYRLEDADYEALTAVSYDDLRPTAVLNVDWDNVTGVSFTVDGETYDVDVMEEETYEETYGSDETNSDESSEDKENSSADDSESTDTSDGSTSDDGDSSEDASDLVYLILEQKIDFDSVINEADALSITSFTDEEHGDTLEVSMTINLDNGKFPSVELEIYQYDSESCLVVLDGETIGLITRSQMVDLRESMTSIVLGLD